jgi:hypothetical protein
VQRLVPVRLVCLGPPLFPSSRDPRARLPAAAVATRVSTDITRVTYFERALVFVDIRIPLSSFRAWLTCHAAATAAKQVAFAYGRMFKICIVFTIKNSVKFFYGKIAVLTFTFCAGYSSNI